MQKFLQRSLRAEASVCKASYGVIGGGPPMLEDLKESSVI